MNYRQPVLGPVSLSIQRRALPRALTGIALGLASTSATKVGVAWVSGGRGYALRLLPGIVAMLLAFVLALWLL